MMIYEEPKIELIQLDLIRTTTFSDVEFDDGEDDDFGILF